MLGMGQIMIRRATEEDVAEILEIYNDAIIHTTATFDVKVQTLEEKKIWFHGYNDRYPLLVAELDGDVVGYGSLSPFRSKEAYKSTVENSVYVHPKARGKGIAKKLLQATIDEGRKLGYHVIIAGITKGNEKSIQIHEAFGFEYAGCMKEVGYKFDKWLDVYFYQLIL